MQASAGNRAIAIVGVGAVVPGAPTASAFWENIRSGTSSITEVPPDRWDTSVYFDPDPQAVDRTYSRIGGWVKEYDWNPLAWKLPIPPRVSALMDATQKLAIVAAREALADYGYPQRPLDHERTAVIFGNAMGGDNHLMSAARILFPEIAQQLVAAKSFAELPAHVRTAVLEELQAGVRSRFPDITEDTMPGELSNISAGRIAALYDFRGPNFVTDAACASAMAAISAAVEGLEDGSFDVVLTGGMDSNMSASSFVKFCKIGALSATGSRPYAEGADGFVMGEGGVVLVLKRLEDAEAAGDKVYAVIRGIGGSSDGKGKGITAPNPIGQKLALQRAWENAGARPEAGDLIEGHGTSTKVGDVVEVNSLIEVIGASAPAGSIALGSVKSNIGHLKAAAGSAGVLKAALALRDRVLPPSINFHAPNPGIDFAHAPLRVNTELREWQKNGSSDGVRRAGISSFGFGGTNFHVVLEEYIPGRIRPGGRSQHASAEVSAKAPAAEAKAPLRGALVLGGANDGEVRARLVQVLEDAKRGIAPKREAPLQRDLDAEVRIAIDFADAAELAELAEKAVAAIDEGGEGRWRALRNKGVFLGRGRSAGKVAFLYTGQGSQYVNMLRELRNADEVVHATFAEADEVMTPILGMPLTQKIYVDASDETQLASAEAALRQTAVTQPAVLTVDTALSRLFQAYGAEPDMVMGHSLGEYGALVAADALPFADALKAVSTRGETMTQLSLGDNGIMAAVFAAPDRVSAILETIDGYAVIANINSTKECVVGGASDAMLKAIDALKEAGIRVQQLSVSHAFHTKIVENAAPPLMRALGELDVRAPKLPVVANVTGDFYPTEEPQREKIIEILGQQVGSPVQFVKGLETLYAAGARVFIEMGPKRVLNGLVDDVLGEREGVVSFATNHPRTGDLVSVNRTLCGLYALGRGRGRVEAVPAPVAATPVSVAPAPVPQPVRAAPAPVAARNAAPAAKSESDLLALGRLFANVLEQGMQLYGGSGRPAARPRVGITGAALGLPGRERLFDDGNVAMILRGEQFISKVPDELRHALATRGITRLVKGAGGEASFETIDDPADVIKLAGRAGALDLVSEFGFPEERLGALDHVTKIAIAAGIDALRDAGIPMVQRYRTTTTGSRLPIGWSLPDEMRDDTGIVFTSAFPGYDNFAKIIAEYHEHKARTERVEELHALRAHLAGKDAHAVAEVDRRIAALEQELARAPFRFDRRFLFQVLSMGHSQFAEYIGARGPNTATNAACASATQAISIAKDWIETGRCRRVIVITADDITTDTMFPWFASGFLASGAAATDERVEDAALPFDRRRHGLIIGMGGAALVVESLEAADERAVQPICEILGSVVANSAFHGSRLDVEHIVGVMERLVSDVEREHGLDRQALAPETVFVSHETFTPARGGSASAEVFALRRVFGQAADSIVVANTKGFTGHPMAVGIEDTLAVKMLETGIVPPVANFRDVDPELGVLNLSRGGAYPVRYALRLAAGFGSQISMMLLHWLPPVDGARRSPQDLGFRHRITDQQKWQAWLRRVSGVEAAELEVVQRTLRVKAAGGARVSAPAAPEVAPVAAPQVSAAPVAATQAAPASTPAPVAAAVASGESVVRERVLSIVAAQTGYPVDMLDPELDLEADLGIDTVKQAEMFAAIRSEYGIERDENLALRDYPTLGRAIEFVFEKRPDLRSAVAAAATPAAAPTAVAAAAPAPQAASVPAPASDEVREVVISIIAQQTGYPADMLDPELDLEADLGIDTVKQAEMFAAIRGHFGIERDENLALRDYPTLARAIEFVYEKRPDLRSAAVVAAPVVAAPTAVEPAATPAGNDRVRDAVIAIVAAQTGYPADMLDLELDLEADLGIDTVKQAEMFAAIRGEFSIERDENLALRDYPTLARAIEFVYEKKPELRGGTADVIVAEPTAAVAVEAGADLRPAAVRAGDMAAAQAVPRRLPVARVRPALAQFAPTGVTLGAGDRVIVCGDSVGIGDALIARLEKRGVTVLQLAGEVEEALEARLAAWQAEGAIRGVYWLAGLDAVPSAALVDVPQRRQIVQQRVKSLYRTERALYEAFAQPGTFLLSATRLGGRHGYDAQGAVEVIGGAITGLVKSFARERPQALIKAVDFAPGRQTAAIADRLLEETLADAGAVEIGYADGQRWHVALEEQPLAADAELPQGGTYVVTGAAGSIVSAIVADLAAATHGQFYLLDLTPEPDPEDPDVARLDSDREGLKRDIFTRLQANGERATPALVEKELARIERSRAALAAIAAVRAAGGTPYYRSVDLRDAAAVASVLEEVSLRNGRVDVLLHAAGIEISRALPDKKPAEFDLVFDVKVEGWYNLLAGLGEMPLGSAVVFSSIAGRFGNAGQADYSAANDLLCKAMTALPRTHGARGIAIDWTAWAEIGMAARGSIPAIMKAAGIDMLSPAAGIPVVRRELANGAQGEVLIAGALGAMLAERVPGGGLAEANGSGLIRSARTLDVNDGLVVALELDPSAQGFLYDHQINGVPVLPGVMGVELMSEAAKLLWPERSIGAVEDVEFAAPFKFYRGEARTVTVAVRYAQDGEDVIAECELIGTRALHGRSEERTRHFSARVRLVTGAPLPAERIEIAEGQGVDSDAIYQLYFHGPAYRVLEKAWRDGAAAVGALPATLPPNHTPADARLLTAPRLLELAFQTAGLIELADTAHMGLPQRIARVTLHTAAPQESAGIRAVANQNGGAFDITVCAADGMPLLSVEGYQTATLSSTVDTSLFAPLQGVAAGS